MEVGGWSHSKVVCEKSSQNTSKPVLIFWSTMCILSVYTLLKVVTYYYLSVLSLSVMGFQKKLGWAPSKFILELFNFANPLTSY